MAQLRADVAQRTAALKAKGITPGLAPGDAKDGVTVAVPIYSLNQVVARWSSWREWWGWWSGSGC